jgi:hypothetical protein
MVVCPVCEHAQAWAGECDLCGKRLVGLGLSSAPVEPLAGLEPTLSAPVDVAPDRMAELEPTTHQPPGPVLPEPQDWLERTGIAGVAALEAEPIPGLERHLVAPIPGGEEGPAPGVVCRYCRTPAPSEQRFCDRCGMSLRVFRPPPRERSGEGEARCSDCGALASGSRCRSCGARLADAAAR